MAESSPVEAKDVMTVLQSDEPVQLSQPDPSTPQLRRRLTIDAERLDPSALRDGGRHGFFGAADFHLLSNGTLRCPADKLLQPAERLHRKANDVVRFAAKLSDCQDCDKREQCMPARPSGSSGRRLTVALLAPEPPVAGSILTPELPVMAPSVPPLLLGPLEPPIPGTRPILWYDLPSALLRRTFMERLRSQQVEVDLAPSESTAASAPLLTRDQRAHRRLTWASRLARNARCTSRLSTYHVWGLSPLDPGIAAAAA